MSNLAVFAAADAGARTWSERNQRWLSERLSFWRERLERHSVGAVDSERSPSAGDDPDFEPAALRLAALFGLSAFETELLILAAGVELDGGLAEALARAQGLTSGQPIRLAFSLALATLPDPHWDALSPLGPLRHWSLVELDASAGLGRAWLRIDERVLHYLTGVAAFDERIEDIARLDLPSAEMETGPLSSTIASAIGGLRAPLVVLAGAAPARSPRAGRALVRSVFRHVGLRTMWIDADAAGADGRSPVELARRIDREAALAQAGVAFVLDADTPHARPVIRLIEALRSPALVLGSLGPLQIAAVPGRQVRRFEVPPEAVSLGPLRPSVRRAAELALQQFRVEPETLDQALASVDDIEDDSDAAETLWSALRLAARGGLDALAQRLDGDATFDDLVVPPLVSAQLREIASQLRLRHRVYEEWGFAERHRRGLGIAALFTGESGTGKTLAAEIIASEARLDLYRIDLASVVSKYIGETEKHLARLFEAAERSGAVLLFDEADALFGRRSEVRDSHDRYANIEIAYLLQRIESYRGLAILTTNMKHALDRAFQRRIRFVVQFPFPDETSREAIWRRQFPAIAPLGELDYAALARMPLSGGLIRSVALNGAFLAAARGGAIGQDDLVAAARTELAKLDRTLSPPHGGRA